MKRKNIGIKEVADLANVSPGTVSLVMNNNKGVSGKTRKRVMRAAKELGYRPNFIAQGLRKGKTDTIVFVHPTSDTLFLRMLQAINEQVESYSWPVLISCTHDDPQNEASTLDFFSQIKPGGIIMTPVPGNDNTETIKQTLHECNSTVVFLERYIEDIPGDYIGSQNEETAYKITKELIQQGHSRVGCVFNQLNYSTDKERLNGIIRALKEHDIQPQPDWFLTLSPQKPWILEKKLIKFFDDPKTPRALLWSIGKGQRLVDKITEKLNLTNNKNIEIILFDCDELDLPRNTSYLNIIQDSISMGKQAIKLLNERIQFRAQTDNDYDFKKILLPCLKTTGIGIEKNFV